MIFDVNISSVKDRGPYQDSKYIDSLKSYILCNVYILPYNELVSIMSKLVDTYIECGYGLTTRGEHYYPHCYEGLESKLTVTIARDYRYGDIIKIPKNDLLYLALFFIFSLPQELWEQYNFPIVTFLKRSVPHGAEEILGSDMASVFTALMRYGGSISFFEKLRNRWSFDVETGELRRK